MKITKDKNGKATSFTITQPDDWHLHLRDGQMLKDVVGYSAGQFGRVLVMPNLDPPVTTVNRAIEYRRDILSALEHWSERGTLYRNFYPYMTLYLTDHTTSDDIIQARESENVIACKLYPAGATTNSDSGVTDITKIHDALEEMQKRGVVLCVHGEVTDPSVDIFDRESVFIDNVLNGIVRDFPNLRIVMEHVTTKEGIEFVKAASNNVAATITAHHLLINRNAMLVGGIQPHNYCLPVPKREENREALVAAATSGNPKFFLGTDSAPHLQEKKESPCGCAGCFTAPHALALYAEEFESVGALDMLEGFASHFGADFYDLEHNSRTVTLNREEVIIPLQYRGFTGEIVVPFWADKVVQWRLTAMDI